MGRLISEIIAEFAAARDLRREKESSSGKEDRVSRSGGNFRMKFKYFANAAH